jgi:hypothetical protein
MDGSDILDAAERRTGGQAVAALDAAGRLAVAASLDGGLRLVDMQVSSCTCSPFLAACCLLGCWAWRLAAARTLPTGNMAARAWQCWTPLGSQWLRFAGQSCCDGDTQACELNNHWAVHSGFYTVGITRLIMHGTYFVSLRSARAVGWWKDLHMGLICTSTHISGLVALMAADQLQQTTPLALHMDL